MTERLLAGIENPYAQIVAHPTGRLLLRRDPYAYDMETVLEAAAKTACPSSGVQRRHPETASIRTTVHLREWRNSAA